jgi:hypothetical protein
MTRFLDAGSRLSAADLRAWIGDALVAYARSGKK